MHLDPGFWIGGRVSIAAEVIATVDDYDLAAAGGGPFGHRQAEEAGPDDHQIDLHWPGSVRDRVAERCWAARPDRAMAAALPRTSNR